MLFSLLHNVEQCVCTVPVCCPYLIDSLDIVWPDILILEVVGMLPYIYAKQGDKTSGGLEWVLQVIRIHEEFRKEQDHLDWAGTWLNH